MDISELERDAAIIAYGAGQIYLQLPENAKQRYKDAALAFYRGEKPNEFANRVGMMKV